MPLKPKKKSKISKNKYLKPGALAQIRYSRSTSKSCQVIGKKRILLDTEKENNPAMGGDTTLLLSPVLSPVLSPEIKSEMQLAKLPKTPKTPQDRDYDSDSRLESLPLDLLVKLMCHLHHDELRPVFHVSMRIRTAVILARQMYFNYTTPDRTRQEMLNTKTPLPTEHWPFARRNGDSILVPSPQTPKAPRLGPRPSRQQLIDMKQIAAVLFQETPQPPKLALPPGLPRPVFKSVASHRILFCEDELCQAVAQNKLV